MKKDESRKYSYIQLHVKSNLFEMLLKEDRARLKEQSEPADDCWLLATPLVISKDPADVRNPA